MIRVALVALVMLVAAGCTPRPPTEQERYTQACHDRGGFISRHDKSWATVEFTCVGQTTGPQLPPRSSG